MVGNPYHPPKYESSSSSGTAGVLVRSRFPLDIFALREIEIVQAAESLEQRILRAAKVFGFSSEVQAERRWRLSRGSKWHAFYTWDIRKLPTTVTIELVLPTQLNISMHCRSVMSISRLDDARRLAEQLDAFERQLVDNSWLATR